MADAAAIARNLGRIREEVGPGVEILAATKYVDADDLPALHEAGITLVGENRTDALAAKQAAHGDLFTWDFIGHVQSRKVRDIVGRVRLIHAVVRNLILHGHPQAARPPLAQLRAADPHASMHQALYNHGWNLGARLRTYHDPSGHCEATRNLTPRS